MRGVQLLSVRFVRFGSKTRVVKFLQIPHVILSERKAGIWDRPSALGLGN